MRDHKIAEKLDLGLKIARLGLGEIDYIADTIILDDRAAELFELPANMAISRDDLHDRIHPEDRPAVEHQVSCMLSPESEGYISVIHRIVSEDLSVKWLSARKEVTFKGILENGNPKPVSGLVAIQDITEFKEAEARIEYLMYEVAHRSKNMLGVVQGIARLTSRHSNPKEFMRQFTARLSALAANQAILVEDKWTHVDVAHLVKTQLQPYMIGKHDRVVFKGPHITLNDKAAQSIGMALHELATNAVKYGALSNKTGLVEVIWDIDKNQDGSTFFIQWAESGGPVVVSPTRKGFGEKVLRQMASSSVSGKVTLDYDPKGVRWSLRAPLKNIKI